METDTRNEIRAAESRNKDLQSELDRKQHDFDQMMRDHQRSNSDLHGKVRQLEHELDEQRRENVSQMIVTLVKIQESFRN